VELREVSKHFGSDSTRVDALRAVSLDVYPGEVVGLLGPSGSGKSTLLNVIGAITEPSSGCIRLDDEVVYDDRWLKGDLRRLRLDKIGFVFQFHNLIPFLTCLENVLVVLDLAGWRPEAARRRAMELLDYLGVADHRDRYPASLSGGQAQRVAIARALANRPHNILGDEPTASLDSKRAGQVMDLLRTLAQEQDAAIIVVTHDEKIFDRFDRIFHLRDGRLESVESKTPHVAATAAASPTKEANDMTHDARGSRNGVRPAWARPLGALAVAFGLLTIQAGGAVLWGAEAAQAAGAYVPFVVWVNFLAGFGYVAAGLGLWSWRAWAAPLAATIAVVTLVVFLAFGVHVAVGGGYEPRTVAAMTQRSAFWLAVAGLACRRLGCRLARAAAS
jgi:putative ABC transport system ATP-binding protein